MASSPAPADNAPPVHDMDNSGRGPLRVPGFGAIPVNYQLPVDARFAHGICEWRQTLLLTAQELAMVAVMNWVTDKPAWSDDVFDDAIVAQWRAEVDRDLERIVANAMLVNPRLMKGDKTWNWCVEELRDKAADFQKNRYIRVLDTGTCVCKVDAAELQAPSETLRRAFDLLAQECPEKDRRQQRRHANDTTSPAAPKAAAPAAARAPPATDASGNADPPWLETYYRTWARADREQTTSAHMVSAIVDPQLFPLVYGRTRVLQQGGTVPLDNVLASYGAAQVAPPAPRPMASPPKDDSDVSSQSEDGSFLSSTPKDYPWSPRYQSLPCEVAFAQAGGGQGDRVDDASVAVTITSYINGLHPDHADVYRAIEQVLSRAIRPWNDCLIRGHRGMRRGSLVAQLGPVPARIVTFGLEWENEMPDWTTAFRIRSGEASAYYVEEYGKLQRVERPDWVRRPQDISRWQADQDAKLRFLEDLMANPGPKELPGRDSDLWQRAKDYLEQPEPPLNGKALPGDDWAIGDGRTWELLCEKAERLVKFKHPEPGTAFSYREWREGRHGDRPIVPPAPETEYRDSRLGPPHVGFSVALQDCFREQGLQVLVAIHGIELTPETPAYGQGIAEREAANSQQAAKEYAQARVNDPLYMDMLACDNEDWRRGGLQLNDHVVAVAVLAFAVDNVTEPRLEFCQAVSQRNTMLYRWYECEPPEHAPDGYFYRDDGPAHLNGKRRGSEALSEIFGRPVGHFEPDDWSYSCQNLGSVALREGRLVAFPDVLQYRIRPFRLVDETRPGRLRWLTLCLVDPHYRVCSTRNVPPQQHAWWARAVGAVLRRAGRLPQELVDQILAYTEDWPMGVDEARRHRDDMVEEGRQAQYYDEWP